MFFPDYTGLDAPYIYGGDFPASVSETQISGRVHLLSAAEHGGESETLTLGEFVGVFSSLTWS